MEDEVETHSSFGLISFSRTQGGGKRRLFGSVLRDHNGAVRLRIYDHAERRTSLGVDRFYSHGKNLLTEIEMSGAQFAELITTMNVGSGVPCTILYKNGQKVGSPPQTEVEVDRIKRGFRTKMHAAVQGLRDLAAVVDHNLGEANMTAKQRAQLRAAIVGPIERMSMEIGINAPFWLEQFEEASERIVTAAKNEIEAMLTHVVQQAGLSKLREASDLLALPPAEAEGEGQ